MIAAFIGYFIGRTLFGSRVARQIVLYVFVLPLAVVALVAMRAPAFALQSLLGVAVALAMLVGVKRRFFTSRGVIMHALGIAGIVAAWLAFMHLPHVSPHHHLHANATLAWAGFDVAIVRPLLMWTSVCYAVLAGFYLVFLTMRQISMEFLFREYVAWQTARAPYSRSW